MSDDKKDNSIASDIKLAVSTVGIFLLSLIGIGVIDNVLDLPEAYQLMMIPATLIRVGLASAIAWFLIKFAFKNTIGKSIGKVFDNGWGEMNGVEKTRWCIITFLTIFVGTVVATIGG